MQKRGQATIFIIIGLVILAVFLLIFLLRGTISFVPVTQESLESNLADIDEHIQTCIKASGDKYIWLLAKQGGYLNQAEATYRNYFDGEQASSISYLCYNIPDQTTCQNRMLTLTNMETELSEFILKESLDCLSDLPVKSKYKIQTQTPQLTVKIGQDNIALLLEYQMDLTYSELKASRSRFISNIQLPLGRLFDTAQQIVNTEALIGDFETTVYSIRKTELTGKQYIVQKLQPWPDKLYQIKIKDTPTEKREFIFQFFIQGEE